MSGGERPVGAAKGKQPNTEALCQPPPPALTACSGSSCFHDPPKWGVVWL